MRCRPNHFTTFQRLISLVLTIKKLFVQLRSARILNSSVYYQKFILFITFSEDQMYSCTRRFFDRVPSTLTFEYEYQPSTWGSEYEYSKNGTRVVLEYEYCTRVLQHWLIVRKYLLLWWSFCVSKVTFYSLI